MIIMISYSRILSEQITISNGFFKLLSSPVFCMVMNFNPYQIKAINHTYGSMLVIAGPGSGKTAVTINRVRHLMSIGIPASNILTVTFTRAAADEMSDRFSQICRGCDQPVFGTFHSVFLMMLRHYGTYTHIHIVSEREKRYFLKSEIHRYRLETDDEEQVISDIISEISLIKNSMLDISLYTDSCIDDDIFRCVYADYNHMLKNSDWVDYDDILLNTYTLLVNNPYILDYWQHRFQFILVDEFQDVNAIQYNILRLLCFSHNNIFAVGDDDQCIYKFRGSSPAIMKQFMKDFPDCSTVFLDINYRCDKQILQPATNLIKHNDDRLEKDISAVRNCRSSDVFSIIEYPDQTTQYDDISERILNLHKAGLDFSQMAILIRSFHDSPLISKHLALSDIPFTIFGRKPSKYEHFIYKDICAYLKCSLKTAGRTELLRIINRPARYISRLAIPDADILTCMKAIKNYYAADPSTCKRIDLLCSQLSFMVRLPARAAVEYICKAVGYESFLSEYAIDHNISRSSLMDILNDIKQLSARCSSAENLLELINDHGSGNFPTDTDPDAVNIMTMHASKGLEFDTVFLPNINKNIMPVSRCSSHDMLPEERRLMYVAMTRAKCHLHVSFVHSIRGKHFRPSIFIDEITNN